MADRENSKTKSVSFSLPLFKKVESYSNKYFQGNFSSAIGFILCHYFEDSEVKEKVNKEQKVTKRYDTSFLDD